jgi:hypothetical protein
MDYIKIYEKIIGNAEHQNRVKVKGGEIYENHHIIPKSVGGLNNKGNLVLLTPKEHYICHRLLVEIYKNTPFSNKMYYAMWCMINGVGNQKRFSPSSKVYDRLRKEIRVARSVERFSNRKPILQYDLNGVFIERYGSVKEASQTTKINRDSIENCGRGYSKSSGGFIWKYEKDITGKEIKPVINEKSGRKEGGIPWNKGKKMTIGCTKKTKQILQYSLDGFLIKKWECISVASVELKLNRGGIENCALSKSKSSGGFIWRYSSEIDYDTIDSIKINKSGRKKGSIPWNKKQKIDHT